MSGVLHIEWSNGKNSLFWRSSERKRGKGGRPGGLGVPKAPIKLYTRLALLTKALGIPKGNL